MELDRIVVGVQQVPTSKTIIVFSAEVYECTECWAIVQTIHKEHHESWHRLLALRTGLIT